MAGYNEKGFIDDFNRLNNFKVSVIESSWAHDYFKSHYPKVELVLVNNIVQGLTSVLTRNSLVYADNLPAINYALTQEGLTDFTIVGRAEQSYQFSIAVSKDYPLLFSAVQKALSQIPLEQRQKIHDKWFPITVINRTDPRQLWRISGGLILIILIISTLLLIVLKRQSYMNAIYELSIATTVNFKTKKIIKSSQTFSELSGYSTKELIGMDYLKLAAEDVTLEQIQFIIKQLAAGKTWQGEFPAIKKNGDPYWVLLTMTPRKNLFNQVTQVLITRQNITDRKRVEQLSITDELTGLYNRRKFNEMLPQELLRAKREKNNLVVIMLDIDFFKQVNDQYGHDKGDEVLVMIAKALQNYFHRASDSIYRIGGEEFVIITQFDCNRALEVYINQLLIHIRALGIENCQSPLKVVTISAGAVLCTPEKQLTAEEMLHHADELLYQAKNNGRNAFYYKVINE